MSPQTSRFISAKQICETYKICRSTLRRLSQHPNFPVAYNVSSLRLWDATVIKAFFEQGQSAQQLMAHFNISRSTWWQWRQLPGFPEPLLPGHLARWNLNAVDTFMRKQRKRSAPASSSLIASGAAAQ